MSCPCLGRCGCHPGTKYGKSLLFVDAIGLRCNVGRDPLRERHDAFGVATRWCVLLSNLSKLFGSKTLGKSNKEGPVPPMDQRDFSADEPAHQNLVRVGYRTKSRIDVMTLRMCPPAALYDFADDGVRKARRGPFGRSEDDAVPSNERQCVASSSARRHDAQRDEVNWPCRRRRRTPPHTVRLNARSSARIIP